MKETIILQIIKLMDKKLDMMSDEQFCSLEYQFSTLKNVASRFEKDNVTCYTNLYYINGHAIEGICLLTDGEPGGLVYQTPQNESKTVALPVMQIISPEEWDEWIKVYEALFAPKFPPYTEAE